MARVILGIAALLCAVWGHHPAAAVWSEWKPAGNDHYHDHDHGHLTCEAEVQALKAQVATLQYQLSQLSHGGHGGIPGPAPYPGGSCSWRMVFKIVAGAPGSSYGIWKSRGGHGDQVHPSLTGHSHYRSPDLDRWSSLHVTKVKVTLVVQHQHTRDIIFNAHGCDMDNWFTKDRLLSSPWTDLKTAPTNFFSIRGDNQYNRRFFIHRSYGGCANDRGWLIVLDPGAECPWEKRVKSRGNNQILFSRKADSVQYERDWGNVGQADALAIYIQSCSGY
ncbi:uncharacterized protein LOC118415740 [Branchiostoma floridae]|uniref:Uncharacterized protein LOC118415740 n=1 Tax=Branchiostoma floridae TaxID=7739 RepID=A0A9J7L4Z0_BRAFL|nr:uncharacterized protein LOC118415740 [Branchiostoma floridae]